MHTKSALAASVGGALEWYDFIIYGFFAGVLGEQFFPKSDDYVQHLLIFLIFAVGYLARTAGGLIFGHIGDRHGRSISLTSTMFIGGVATVCMALMPSYAKVGAVASVLFMLARIIQGITIGANISGAIVYIAELTTKRRRGFWVSTIFLGTQRGVLLAGCVSALLLSYLSKGQLQNWGWRVAFLIGILVMFLSWYSKEHLIETPYYMDLRQHNKIALSPIKLLFTHYKLSIIRGIGLTTVFSTITTFLLFYMPTFLRFYGIPQQQIIHITFYNLFVFSSMLPVLGWFCDLIGPRKLLIYSSVLLIILAYPCTGLIIQHNIWLRYIGLTVMIIDFVAIATTIPVILSGLFATAVRFSGVGFTYNICQSVFIGIAPLVFAIAGHYLHSQRAAIVIVFTIGAVISLLTLLWIKPEHDWLHKKELSWDQKNAYPN